MKSNNEIKEARAAFKSLFTDYGENACFCVLFGERRHDVSGNPTQLVKVLLCGANPLPSDVSKLLAECCGLRIYKDGSVGICGYADEIETTAGYIDEALEAAGRFPRVFRIR